MSQSVSVVTGANRGIGLELCRELARRGEPVIAACRTPSAALEALQGVEVVRGIDVSADECGPALAGAVGARRVLRLINNAGVFLEDRLQPLGTGPLLEQFEVNALGPLRVTWALVDHLEPSAKVAILTSRMGSIADNTSGGYYGYRMSKAAVNAAGKSLALDLKGRGITVLLLHPGFVRTEMTKGAGNVEAPDSARALLARIDEATLEQTGQFLHMNGDRLPW